MLLKPSSEIWNLRRFAGTPIAASLAQVANDLASAQGSKTVILITDGEESCEGDVEAEILALRSQDIDVILNIIGLPSMPMTSIRLRENFKRWAELGGVNTMMPIPPLTSSFP
ncbi:MAG: hypothetical protein R2865_12050 [Deinococcales bacterium]